MGPILSPDFIGGGCFEVDEEDGTDFESDVLDLLGFVVVVVVFDVATGESAKMAKTAPFFLVTGIFGISEV